MKPSLFQCQVRAIFIGLLWWVPYLSILRYLPSPVALVFLLGFPVLIAFLVAVLTGPFDLLAIVSLLIPASYDFLISTHQDWVWHSRHAGTLVGPSPILDVLTLVATAIFAVIGIALKRLLVTGWKLELSPREVRSLYRCLSWDVGLLVVIVAVLLSIDGAKIAHENNPQVLAETRKEILVSPTATEADKLQVVMKLNFDRSPEAMDVLREALKSPLLAVKCAAAANLLEKGDSSGLPVLEEQLMHSSKITITNEHQVIHSDWLGYGEGGPDRLTPNLSQALANITDPNALPILTRLMASADPDTRSGAAQAVYFIRLDKAHSYGDLNSNLPSDRSAAIKDSEHLDKIMPLIMQGLGSPDPGMRRLRVEQLYWRAARENPDGKKGNPLGNQFYPIMVKLLDDPDQQVQYSAMGCIFYMSGEIRKNTHDRKLHLCAVTIFQQNPELYLQQYRDWWEKHKNELISGQ